MVLERKLMRTVKPINTILEIHLTDELYEEFINIEGYEKLGCRYHTITDTSYNISKWLANKLKVRPIEKMVDDIKAGFNHLKYDSNIDLNISLMRDKYSTYLTCGYSPTHELYSDYIYPSDTLEEEKVDRSIPKRYYKK